jgi:hypothetical protein
MNDAVEPAYYHIQEGFEHETNISAQQDQEGQKPRVSEKDVDQARKEHYQPSSGQGEKASFRVSATMGVVGNDSDERDRCRRYIVGFRRTRGRGS